VPLGALLRTETTEHSVTKYDADTGKPYEKKLAETRVFLGNQDVTEAADEYAEDRVASAIDSWCQYGPGKALFNRQLTVVTPASEACAADTAILGVSLEQPSRDRLHANVQQLGGLPALGDAFTAARTCLDKLGYTGEIHLYVIKHESC
jgi:hypothetical protein